MTQATKAARAQPGRAQQAAESVSPSQLLQASLQQLAGTLTERAVSNLTGHLGGAADRLTDYAETGGGPGLFAAVTGIDKLTSGASPMRAALSAGVAGATGKVRESLQGFKDSVLARKGRRGGKKIKLTNIVEYIDV